MICEHQIRGTRLEKKATKNILSDKVQTVALITLNPAPLNLINEAPVLALTR